METLCRLSYWGGARARGAVDGSQRYTAPPPFRQTVRSPRPARQRAMDDAGVELRNGVGAMHLQQLLAGFRCGGLASD